MKKIEVELSDRAEEFLGPNHAETVVRLADKEALRLWYIGRSKPKTRVARPVGRPRLTPEAKKAREIGDSIGNVYVELRQRLSQGAFETLHGEDYRRLKDAVAKDDLDTLLGFEKNTPWQK